MRTGERIAVLVTRWKHVLVILVVALMTIFPMSAESGLFEPEASPPTPPGTVIGRIELVPGVPMRNCKVLMGGLPLGTTCNKEGFFEIRGIPMGRRDLYVTGEWVIDKKYFTVGVNKDATTTVTLVVSHYGAIIGRVINADPKHLAEMYVTIADFGIAAKPDANGYYALDRVPPGNWPVILHNVPYNSPPIQQQVATVQPKQITQKVDFLLRQTGPFAQPPPAPTPTIFNVSGQWKSSIGATYNITQQQNNFQWTVLKSSEKGNGTLKGYDVNASWQGPKGRGSSPGKITEVDPRGRATKIIWDNGVQFSR